MKKGAGQIRTFETSLGWMACVGSGSLLRYLSFGYESQAEALRAASGACPEADPETCDSAEWNPRLVDRLHAYASGEEVDFSSVQIDTDDLTPFQTKVVALCRRIPHGTTRTYGQLAAQAGSPRAARAVGSVMRSNRFPLVVPCHRVVGADGRLRGFSAVGGIETKRRLIELEQGELAHV